MDSVPPSQIFKKNFKKKKVKKKTKKPPTLRPLFMDGVQLPQG